MDNVIDKTKKLIDSFESSELISKLDYYKRIVIGNKELLDLKKESFDIVEARRIEQDRIERHKRELEEKKIRENRIKQIIVRYLTKPLSLVSLSFACSLLPATILRQKRGRR